MSDARLRWSKVKEIFDIVQDLPPDDREARVRILSATDADLEREVLRLLKLDGLAGDDFLEQPALDDFRENFAADQLQSIVSAGDILAGRYRVIAAIGSGGMGEVFEARDEVIGETIAVKILRPHVESVDTAAARWRREVLLARKVSHSGVCRVHDVAIHHQNEQALLLLTMERLHGESLQARLARGKMDLAEALTLARQIGVALDAAHGQHVLHRDIKPANVILAVRDGHTRAVLTDFGLARELSVTANGPVTRSGWVAGTPGYLAPELLRGGTPSVASDLYAFGVVVRNLMEATLPVPTHSVESVFERALHPEPSARFSSARELVDELEKAVAPPKGRRRVPLLAVAAVGALALIAIAPRFYDRGTTAATSVSQVLMTDMVNATGAVEFDGAGEIFRAQLAQSPQFELIDDRRIQDVLKQMGRPAGPVSAPETAREVAMRDGVPLVAYSALTRLGRDHVLSVKLEEMGARPSMPRREWTRSFTASSPSAVFDAVRDAAIWVRQVAGEVPATLEAHDRAPAETTTSSWEALRLFRQANDLGSQGRPADAALLLEQAIRIDPEFAMAHTRLGDHLISLKRDKEGYAAWERAIALAERKQLTTRETLRIRGQYYDDTGNLGEAEKAYRAYAVHYPNDFFASFLLGATLADLDRVSEATSWLQRARVIRPASLSASVHLAMAHLDLGLRDEARALADDLENIGFRDWAQWIRAVSTFTTGNVSGALTLLEPVRASSDPVWKSRTCTIRASWLAESGDDSAALAELRAGIDFDSANGLRERMAEKWLHVAELQSRTHDAAAVDSVQNALSISVNARRLASAVGILVRANLPDAARRLMPRFDDRAQVPVTIAARQRARAELLRTTAQAAEAVRIFEQGFSLARRSESRLPLARALVRAGDLPGAERVLRSIADHPIAFYAGPEPPAPGLWRQAVTELVGLVARRDPLAAEQLRQTYPVLQPHR